MSVTFLTGLLFLQVCSLATAGFQCVSDLPNDGGFANCALNSSWKIASHVGGSSNPVDFVDSLNPPSLSQARKRVYTATLSALNAHVTESGHASGNANITIIGDRVELVLEGFGLDINSVHVAHVHGSSGRSSCPPSSADTNSDGIIDVIEGLPSYGPILIPLDGDISIQAGGSDFHPTSDSTGHVLYRGVGSLDLIIRDLHSLPDPDPRTGLAHLPDSSAVDFSHYHLVVHGINSSVSLPSTVQSIISPQGAPIPATASIPVLCGPFALVFDSANEQSSGDGCALQLAGSSTVYQKLPAPLDFVRHKLSACGKSLGTSDCHVEVRDSFNRMVDWLTFRPSPQITCSNDTTEIEHFLSNDTFALCHSLCSDDGWTDMKVRYVGLKQTNLLIRQYGDTDAANWLHMPNVRPGDTIELAGADFPSLMQSITNTSLPSDQEGLLPPLLEISSSADESLTLIPTECSVSSNFTSSSSTSFLPVSLPPIGPGQAFGDVQQFLLLKAKARSGPVCPVVESPGVRECGCENEQEAQQFCMESEHGFIPLPDEVYFVGLVSEECACTFDNICLMRAAGGGTSGAWWE